MADDAAPDAPAAEPPKEEAKEEEKQEEPPAKRRPTLRRQDASRKDHLQQLLKQHRASLAAVDEIEEGASKISESVQALLPSLRKKQIEQDQGALKDAGEIARETNKFFPQTDNRVEVRMKDFYYTVQVDPNDNQIQTVFNQSYTYAIWNFFKVLIGKKEKPHKESKFVLENINLNFEPGKMYLILGPPASGKTTLLQAVAGRLSMCNNEQVEGSVLYNGMALEDERDLYIENVITFIGQLDFHAPRLTVKETFDFAFQCKSGGTHADPKVVKTDAAREFVKKLDAADARPHLTMKVLGLDGVQDTFVGNADVRGVSGGQRRRVTCGEMCQSNAIPVMCADEISTGLDAASTFDICNSVMQFNRVNRTTRVLSLLQPSPETVSLFDEVILLSEGRVLYAGPVEDVEDYFADLGYVAPDQMDVADFLQNISTPDGVKLYQPSNDYQKKTPYTQEELANVFRDSPEFQRIIDRQGESYETKWEPGQSTKLEITQTTAVLMKKYQNSGLRSLWLNLYRNLVIWSRDRRFLIANAIKNVIMGVSVGGVFYQTDNIISIYGVLFQLNLFIMLGALTSVPEQVDDRIIFYRHFDDNFYGALAYAFGKGTSLLPQALTDVTIFGTICYFMVGLETAAGNFFIYLMLLFVFSVTMNQQLSIFTAIAPTKGVVQAAGSGILLFMLVFCGFIIPPTVVPNYYIWLYWWVPLAWSYRALVVNEFTSPTYSDVANEETGETEGDLALTQGGMVHNGEPFGREWIGYAFAYLVPYLLLCTFVTGLLLRFVRVEARSSPAPPDEDEGVQGENVPSKGDSAEGEKGEGKGEQEGEDAAGKGDSAEVKSDEEGKAQDPAGAVEGDEEAQGTHDKETGVKAGEEDFNIPFIPVTLTYSDICYDVKASKGKDTLRLLNNCFGVFVGGRMCALMGSSGAGKTTLMDVIALRKTSGTITGDVRLNGFEQEKIAFRRCSGYVEQFDVQQPELTVRETVLFSARLRLDSSDPDLKDDKVKQKFVDYVLRTLELTSLANCVVGIDGQGGLSFEQRKRVSIAVELAASPSVIFLDEPTSGLDSRAAMLVVRTLRKISDQGRTVVATIHQPSSEVFEMFDDLLLLKKGGRTVFAGELGVGSKNLVEYLESRGATPINRGENPANWMLTVITDEAAGIDWAQEYNVSPEFESTKTTIQSEIDGRDPTKEIKYDTQFAAPGRMRMRLVSKQLRTVYWRSPAYNLLRMTISVLIAFILGSIFITRRLLVITSEQTMTAIVNTVFISFIIVGVQSINSVLPVMLTIRDNFYRHRAAGMLSYWEVAYSLGVAEKWFIVISAAAFCLIFLPCIGLGLNLGQGFGFWGFFCFNTAIYSYFGQAFVCMVPTVPTAQILAAVFIGLNNFFSGLIVRPQYLSGFFEIPYWITPGHYVFEGMVMVIFPGARTNTTVVAAPGSDFYNSLIASGDCDAESDTECSGSVEQFIDSFFGGRFSKDHIWYDAVVLGGFLILARLSTFLALKYFNYMNT